MAAKLILLVTSVILALDQIESLAIPLASSTGSYHSPYSGYLSSHMASYSSGYKRPSSAYSAALTSAPLIAPSNHYGYSGYPSAYGAPSSYDYPTAYDSGYEMHGSGYY